MKKKLLQYLLILCLGAGSTSAYALSDDFLVSGQDLDFLAEIDSDFALEEIEYELRKFVFYRKLEDLLFDLSDEYPGISQ